MIEFSASVGQSGIGIQFFKLASKLLLKSKLPITLSSSSLQNGSTVVVIVINSVVGVVVATGLQLTPGCKFLKSIELG